MRRRARTTVPEPSHRKVPDLLQRDFTAPAPNRRYVGDIACLPVGDGQFLYLAVIDLCSRRLVGWSIADHVRTELVIDALEAAARARGGRLDGAVFHSDHGPQYGSADFADACARLGVVRSMGAVGTSADNAAAEAFNATLKRETLQGRRRWSGAREARLAVSGGRLATTRPGGTRPSATQARSATNNSPLWWLKPHNTRCPHFGGNPRNHLNAELAEIVGNLPW